jgi:hypothetical protein
VTVVRAYMAHHQGMSLLALANVVLDGITRRRFHGHPIVQAAELLLEERTPREIVEARIPLQETSPETWFISPRRRPGISARRGCQLQQRICYPTGAIRS